MNIFEMHNRINYFYTKDPSRLSYRLIRELTCSYEPKYINLYFDVFGQLGNDRKFFDLPGFDGTPVIEACLERAKQLSGCKLMWSGGIDSTFLLACFRAAGSDVKVYHYNNKENYVSPALMKFVRNNFDVKFLNNNNEIVAEGPAYLGSLADCFFFSHQRLRGTFKAFKLPLQHGRLIYKPMYYDKPFMPLQDLMGKLYLHEGKDKKTRVFSDSEIADVLAYAERMNVPLDTNERIARFLCFTCSLAKQAFGWSGPFYHGLDSFFLTQKFINIAYTRYWDSNEKPWLHDKKMFKDFIVDIFGSDFGVEKNFF